MPKCGRAPDGGTPAMHISRRTATLLFLSLSATAWPPVCEKPALPLPKHTSPSRYVSPASSDSLASGHLCTQAPASSTSGLWAPAPASSDSLASGHLCTQAPASSTSGLWAPAPASSDSLASGHLHMHYICVHTQLLAQTRVRTRGDLVSMYLSRGPCFSRKGCLPRSCAIDQFVCLPVGGRLANLHFGAQRKLKCFLIRRPILRPLIRRPILRPSPRFCRYSGTNSGYTEYVSI